MAPRALIYVVLTATAATLVGAASASREPDPTANGVASYWTAERRAHALPRDLVIDARGRAYLRLPGGVLRPHGHDVEAEVRAAPATPNPAAGKPGGGGSDTTPPSISGMDPAPGQTIGSSYAFKAEVKDAGSGVKSVSFVIRYPDGRTQSFAAARGSNDVWSLTISGFWNGGWAWQVTAKDNASRGGNTATSDLVLFTVDTSGSGGGGGGGGGTVTNAEWTGGGKVQTAIGRVYFEMPANPKHTRWTGYVCSGTAVTDSASNAVSVVLTAAHCVYDDANKAFARNVLFIPNQAGTTGAGTDLDCANDPLGCWAPQYGVVDSDWASRTWPDNIPWDYAYYVVPTSGAHSGAGTHGSLEAMAGTLGVSFSAPSVGALTHALGYSYSEDPKLMYCAEGMGTEGASNWWLSQCGLSGGSSGGPWIQPLSNGAGPVVSVNSWGYSGSPGMAGPKLSGTSASCLFSAAQNAATPTAGGLIPSGC